MEVKAKNVSHTRRRRVLLPGLFFPDGLQNSPSGIKTLGNKTPPPPGVSKNMGLLIFVIELFPIEEMWCYCKMGRERKGLIEQSKRKPKVRRSESERGTPMTYFHVPNRDVKNLFLPEEAVEFMKNMNPQRLVNFLLPDDNWYVKTLSGNASGS